MDHNPYTTPNTNTQNHVVPGIYGPYGKFRENSTLKTILVSLLILDTLLTIFSNGILNYFDMKQYENETYLLNEGTTQLDNIVMWTGASHALLILTTIVTFAIWINRSCKNAWLLDPPRMSTTPRWAVGYYFIPILNLWKPFSAMKEIRSASHGNDNAMKNILGLWWTFWLISNFVANLSTRNFTETDTPDEYIRACKLTLVTVPIDVILNYLAFALVVSITAAQNRRAAQWRA